MKELMQAEPLYFILAAVGTSLFILKMILLLVAGDGDASDLDVNVDGGDAGHMDGGEAFSIVSIQSILAFFMGAGWAGLAARREWYIDDKMSIIYAGGFGLLMMLFSSFITFKIKKLNHIPKFDMKKAIGMVGNSYSSIPAGGIGQIEIILNEKKQVLKAMNKSEQDIESFKQVKVVSIDDAGNLIVEKA